MNISPELLILAIVAIVILYKLYFITGSIDEDAVYKYNLSKNTSNNSRIIDLKPEPELEKRSDVHSDAIIGIKNIQNQLNNFSVDNFLNGAKGAFEIITVALCQGDKKTLKILLCNSIYNDFCKSIDIKLTENKKYDPTIISIKAEIVTAIVENKKAKIGVMFLSEQTWIVRDIDNNIVEGDTKNITTSEDIWIFSRDLASSNPTWLLEEIPKGLSKNEKI